MGKTQVGRPPIIQLHIVCQPKGKLKEFFLLGICLSGLNAINSKLLVRVLNLDLVGIVFKEINIC